ncbi:hypothetical protein GCM10029978_067380 [Actinoallomurus acanthiterrae]
MAMSRCPYRVGDPVWCTYAVDRTSRLILHALGIVLHACPMNDGTWRVTCRVPLRPTTVAYHVNDHGDDQGRDLDIYLGPTGPAGWPWIRSADQPRSTHR